MIEVILHRRLAETPIPLNGVLNGVPYNSARTSAASFEYWWRWDDDPDMRPQYLASTEVGTPVSIPFNTQGRDIRLYQMARTRAGTPSDPLIAETRQLILHLIAPDSVLYGGDPVIYATDPVIY